MRWLQLLALLGPLWLFAQERCGVNAEYFKDRRESIEHFENWLSLRSAEHVAKRTAATGTKQVKQIPVVFHVIHNGEAVGKVSNISDERLLDQIRILNEDFRRTNADSALTPDEFLNFATDTEIEFVMAKRDPEGLPTTGIVRKKGNQSIYEPFRDEVALKSQSYWPAEDYLNIYVANLDRYLGVATFPYSDLEGILDVNTNRLLDAVVLDYIYVGVNETTGGSFASFGRTATHEIGHFLGLRHVWGDGNCQADDYCFDTPFQSVSYNTECPNTPQESCESSDMYSNYLNYTADACMNIFTKCQRNRMHAVLESSPRRVTLPNSPALQAPIQVANDLGIRRLLAPVQGSCSTTGIPSLEIRNYGTNVISDYAISLTINGVEVERLERSTSLNILDIQVVNFSEVDFQSDTDYQMEFEILSVNGSMDANTENNYLHTSYCLEPDETLPFLLDFEDSVLAKTRTEYEFESQWGIANAPKEVSTNLSAAISFNGHPETFGYKDYLITPEIDLGNTSASLTFSWAYPRPVEPNDKNGLIVAVSLDCGQTFQTQHYLVSWFGNQLSSTFDSDPEFIPPSLAHWQTATLDLTGFAKYESLVFAFIGVNGGRGILYLDDVQLTPNEQFGVDIGISEVRNLPLVTCQSVSRPILEIRNYGLQTIQSFTTGYAINGDSMRFPVTGMALGPGDLTEEVLPIELNPDQTQQVHFFVEMPNDTLDEHVGNDAFSAFISQDDLEEELPIREDFEGESDWLISNATHDPIWRTESLENSSVLVAEAFSHVEVGTDHWFISPVLHASTLDSLALQFDYAYAKRPGFTDRFSVMLSANCGNDFDFTLFEQSSEGLTQIEEEDYYVPEDDEWQTVQLDLNEYVGQRQFRIAFVFTNGNGNNFYLDNISFFNTFSPVIPPFNDPVAVYPVPAKGEINLSFDLSDKEDLTIFLLDLNGRMIKSESYQDVLNHVVKLPLPGRSGLFLIKVEGETFQSIKKVIITK